jgi:thioredoxin reductase
MQHDEPALKQYDAIIIGGSFAGLSAAMYLARGRRSVCVIDAGQPRNRFALHSHGFFGHDGGDPGDMLATARAQVAAYPTVTFIEGTAATAASDTDGFTVTLASGEVLHGRRLVLAFGISDQLPAIPGLPERWGKSVIHCPYCHGYEFSGRRLGVLQVSPAAIHQAMLIAEWGPTTLFLNGSAPPDDAAMAELAKRGVTIEPAPVVALHGDGLQLSEVELDDSRRVGLDALYLGAPTRLNSGIAEQLGCELEEGTFGPVICTDGSRMTSVPGVYAAGDIARASHNITWASADGVMAGMAAHRSLVF